MVNLNYPRPSRLVRLITKETDMNLPETTASILQDATTDFQEILDDLAKGIRRPEKMQAACARMDRLREENRQLFGEQNIAVALVRQTRDQV